MVLLLDALWRPVLRCRTQACLDSQFEGRGPHCGRGGIASAKRGMGKMRIERRYTEANVSPYALIEFQNTRSEIRNPDGSVVFSLDNIEVPANWSQVAADVLAQKYFRKAGIPARLKRVEENSVPSFLWRSVPDDTALSSLPKEERMGSET